MRKYEYIPDDTVILCNNKAILRKIKETLKEETEDAFIHTNELEKIFDFRFCFYKSYSAINEKEFDKSLEDTRQQLCFEEDIVMSLGMLSSLKEYLKKQVKRYDKNTVVSYSLEEFQKPLHQFMQKSAIDIEEAEGIKKDTFNPHSDKLKISSISSFKGFEAKNVFLILTANDIPELVYCGITRAKKNLIIFDVEGSNYKAFFERNIPK